MIRQSTSKRVGIRDWLAKRELLKALYGCSTVKGLFLTMVSSCYKNKLPSSPPRSRNDSGTTFLEAVLDAQRRWVSSRPTDDMYLQLWERIRSDLNLDCVVVKLFECSFEEFVDLLGNQVLRDYAEALAEDTDSPLTDAQRRKLLTLFSGASLPAPGHGYCVHRDRRTHYESSLSALQDGRYPIWRFYNAPEAARAWTTLIESENYRMYLDCLCSLKQLVQEAHWIGALRERRYNAAVSLAGGGSPEKDLVLVKSLVKALDDHRGEIEYTIVDISDAMIHETERFLGPRLRSEQLNRVRVTDLSLDILQLEGRFMRGDSWQHVVWAILGGTIGNLPEREFFRSLKEPSRSGDLLIVGLDTHDDEGWEQFERRMKGQYGCKELDFLLEAQPRRIGQAATPIPVEDSKAPNAVERSRSCVDGPIVEVGVRKRADGDPDHHVCNSWIAEFKYRSDDRSKVLGSTRYVLAEFLAFAREFGGWEHVGTTAAPDGSTFRQFLLRRI